MKTQFKKNVIVTAALLLSSTHVLALTASQQRIYDQCVQQQQQTMFSVDTAARQKTGYIEVVNQEIKRQNPDAGSFVHTITNPPAVSMRAQNPNGQVPSCTEFLNGYANSLLGSALGGILGDLGIGGKAAGFISGVASTVSANQINNSLCNPIQSTISGTFNKFCYQAGQQINISSSCSVSSNGTISANVYGNTGGPVNIGGNSNTVFNPVSGTFSANQGVSGPGANASTRTDGNIYNPTVNPLQQPANPSFFSTMSNTVSCWFSSGPECK